MGEAHPRFSRIRTGITLPSEHTKEDSLYGRIRHLAECAARLGWAHLAGLSQLRVERGRLLAIRQFGRGASEAVWARLPAIVRLQADAAPLRYVARARLAEVGSRVIEQIPVSGPSPTPPPFEVGSLQVSRPRTRLGAAPNTPAPAKANARLGALMSVAPRPTAAPVAKPPAAAPKTPDEMAAEIVRYLAHHQLL